jgi:hypothetical protein
MTLEFHSSDFQRRFEKQHYIVRTVFERRSQWPRGLRRRSSAARLLGLWIRIPPGVWMSVCCDCCIFSGRDLCDGLITRVEEFYRVCLCVWSRNIVNEEALAHWGLLHQKQKECIWVFHLGILKNIFSYFGIENRKWVEREIVYWVVYVTSSPCTST